MVKAAPQNAVPKGTMITAIKTKTMASRSVILFKGDLMKRRIPAAANTFCAASKASQCKA